MVPCRRGPYDSKIRKKAIKCFHEFCHELGDSFGSDIKKPLKTIVWKICFSELNQQHVQVKTLFCLLLVVLSHFIIWQLQTWEMQVGFRVLLSLRVKSHCPRRFRHCQYSGDNVLRRLMYLVGTFSSTCYYRFSKSVFRFLLWCLHFPLCR